MVAPLQCLQPMATYARASAPCPVPCCSSSSNHSNEHAYISAPRSQHCMSSRNSLAKLSAQQRCVGYRDTFLLNRGGWQCASRKRKGGWEKPAVVCSNLVPFEVLGAATENGFGSLSDAAMSVSEVAEQFAAGAVTGSEAIPTWEVLTARQVGAVAKSFAELPDTLSWPILAGSVLLWVYLTARPGVISGILDTYAVMPLQAVLDSARGRSSFKRTDFVLGQRLGEGSFGTVFMGALLRPNVRLSEEPGRRSQQLAELDPSLQEKVVILKKVKVGVEGAEECGEMEEWFNRRMMRAAPDACAQYLGSFTADATRGQFTEGGKWLVWKYEGGATLYDYMRDRNFPDNLEEVLFGGVLTGLDRFQRNSLVIKNIMRQIITSLKKMHDTGIVHRDVKPANIVITNKGKIKFIDFGAATDLRIGRNYVPSRGMLDPDFCPPEQLVLPEATPEPPPELVAAALSPLLWQWQHPDLFDMYSAGIVLLQMASPQLRLATGWQQFKAELYRCDFDMIQWRNETKSRPNLDLLDFERQRGWDLVTKLVCPRGPLRRGRLSAAEALRHPYFLLGGDVAASALSTLTFSR